MREKILETAAELFLTFGFKSVTMDDIAEKMGISKKTIYAHFSTKTKLVQATTTHLLEKINTGIEDIRNRQENPIIENYSIKRFVLHNLKGEKTSPHYQLQKYYPKILESIKEKQFYILEKCVVENLQRGIKEGYYRETVPVQFITRLHFLGMMGIKDKNLFSADEYTEEYLMENFLEYHLRAICTPKGIKKLEEFISEHEK
ncbi:TetR/AcrR family transcriptional regulator [Gramella sp. AN32]|uniref:TetR/AcrR family transcriptional regulator n=1 Tax=Christiangramia antarctica TaxID=2058158 RepID=A0ABW5WZQ2_9FLAO|nr:TetR/AcrR family transcriptional regulator [Gramella sp. AN32]MCM4155202.1 TetR family transcriptional regulator [Gramella sp. AN32]